MRYLKNIFISLLLTVIGTAASSSNSPSDQHDETLKSETQSKLMTAAERLLDEDETEPKSRFSRFAQWYNWNNWSNWHNWGNW